VLPLSQAAGHVSADIITIYPPGIPILVPGEEVSQTVVEYLQFLGGRGARIDGVLDSGAGTREGGASPTPSEPMVRVLAA
jgi:arginine/lysine/ornithine decarboxylase